MIRQQIGLAVLRDMLEVRVVLYLVDRWGDFGSLQDRVEVLLDVIGNTNRLGTSGSLDGLHLSPFRLEDFGIRGEERRVNQVQVHVVKTQLAERGGEVLLDRLVCLDGSLGGDEQLLARNAGSFDRSSQLLFISVRCRKLVFCDHRSSPDEKCVLTLSAVQVSESTSESVGRYVDDTLIKTFAASLAVGRAEAIGYLRPGSVCARVDTDYVQTLSTVYTHYRNVPPIVEFEAWKAFGVGVILALERLLQTTQ